MKLEFQSTYYPVPGILTSKVEKPLPVYKLKVYPTGTVLLSMRHEFETLHREQYTHIANMPGRLDEIMRNCKYYSIVCLDQRMTKFIAEFCSKNLVKSD